LGLTVAAIILTLGYALKLRATRDFLDGPNAGARGGSALGFTVRSEGGQLFLSWNWQAEAIKTADRAILSITDGNQREDLELDLVVLRTKRLAYSPVTNDVTFVLQVANFKHNTIASESVRVLAPRAKRLSVPAQEHPYSFKSITLVWSLPVVPGIERFHEKGLLTVICLFSLL
jgi:hypothetical protein